MKKIFLLLLLCIPVWANAADKNDKKYLEGAVPEVNGQVLFQQTFSVKGKTKEQIYNTMLAYVKQLMEKQIRNERTRITTSNPEEGLIAARCEEWMEFKKKPLYWDRTRFRYQLTVTASDEKCRVEISQISYYYQEDMEGNNGRTYKAEEWISDATAINKSKTKLLPVSGKFRRKTIDRVALIFEQSREIFEAPVVKKKATEVLSE